MIPEPSYPRQCETYRTGWINVVWPNFRRWWATATPGTELLPPTPDDIQRMVRVSEVYGYWIASPAENAAVTG